MGVEVGRKVRIVASVGLVVAIYGERGDRRAAVVVRFNPRSSRLNTYPLEWAREVDQATPLQYE